MRESEVRELHLLESIFREDKRLERYLQLLITWEMEQIELQKQVTGKTRETILNEVAGIAALRKIITDEEKEKEE